MKRKQGRYYLSRIVKRGVKINTDTLMEAMLGAPPMTVRKFRWTITDTFDGRDEETPFVFGHLSKSADEGHVTIVDPGAKTQREAVARHLLKASAPFVFLPQFSGLAYLHVWNEIDEEIFARRLKSLIEEAHNKFFAECDIEPVTDYTAFVKKLNGLDRFTAISATVHPPNPLFGRLWSSLNQYVNDRNAETVTVSESNESGDGLRTEIVSLIEGILDNPDYDPGIAPAIGDAALLMAADGYGKGRVDGEEDGEAVVIRTSDTQRHFKFFKEPEPRDLARRAAKMFESISVERNMKHGEKH